MNLASLFLSLVLVSSFAQEPTPAPQTAPATTPAPAQSTTAPATAPKSCLILKQAEGHRFRNSVIAGALTGGIGFAVGAASGGAKYEYVDAINFTGAKMKYKGSELEKLQKSGVHIVLVDKTRLANSTNSADEIKAARESCKAN